MKRIVCTVASFMAFLYLSASAAWAVSNECAPDQHNYVETRRTPVTAIEDGEIDYTCSVCEHAYTDIIYATDHIWGNWVTDQNPTCTQPGRRYRTCTRAQPHNQYAAIPALNHNYLESTSEPGCETAGEKVFSCTRCRDTYTERIDSIKHDYIEADRIEPSCLESGKIIFVCANDPAHTYEEPILESGHSFGDWHVEAPAGEGTEGLETRECINCSFAELHAIEALPIETSNPLPVLGIVLVSANTVFYGCFAFLLVPYFLCLAYARRRRKAQELRDALRKEVDVLHGYK